MCGVFIFMGSFLVELILNDLSYYTIIFKSFPVSSCVCIGIVMSNLVTNSPLFPSFNLF